MEFRGQRSCPWQCQGSGFLLPGSVTFPNAVQGAGSSVRGPEGVGGAREGSWMGQDVTGDQNGCPWGEKRSRDLTLEAKPAEPKHKFGRKRGVPRELAAG